jgi:hypothetical protein
MFRRKLTKFAGKFNVVRGDLHMDLDMDPDPYTDRFGSDPDPFQPVNIGLHVF